MKTLVMGAGAVGLYFGARLVQAGEEVVFCARGVNLEGLQLGGIEIQSYLGDFRLKPVTATGRPRDHAPYDLILFCVKAYDSDDAAEAIDGCLAPGGAILTLQNGLENEEPLVRRFGLQAVMPGVARVGAELVAPGKVVHSTSGTIDFGELDGRQSPRALEVAQALRRAGVLGELSADIHSLRWGKLIWNAAFNTVTTLTRRRVGEIIDDPEGVALVRALMGEIRAVACAEGAKLGPDLLDDFLSHSDRSLRMLKTSTLQDYERGKPLEYEALSGAVVRAARRHGIAVPVTEAIYRLLKLLDAGLRSNSAAAD
jgi:2-dehydropantoate 2-reductase